MEQKRTRRWSKRIVVFMVATMVALGVGVAFAAWNVSGNGNGSATATSALALTASPATTTAQLYPGITGANLYVTVGNPNPFQVTVTSVAPNGPATADALHAACSVTGVTFTTTTVSQIVSAGGNATFTVPGVSMSNASDTGCQGATFTIPVTVSGASS
jgi:hypothetical protein